MVHITALWLPIVLSALIVFIASWVMHVLLPYHWSNYKEVPGEDEVRRALRGQNVPPGDYVIPYAGSSRAMAAEPYVAKRKEGPVLVMTVMKEGPVAMGKELLQWFVYCLLISVFAAYIAGHALGPGAHYLSVFRFAGATAFIAYALSDIPRSIWYHQSWSTTLKYAFDGLVYSLLTAGVFGWLWPGA